MPKRTVIQTPRDLARVVLLASRRSEKSGRKVLDAHGGDWADAFAVLNGLKHDLPPKSRIGAVDVEVALDYLEIKGLVESRHEEYQLSPVVLQGYRLSRAASSSSLDRFIRDA